MRCFHCTEQVAPADRGRWQVTHDGVMHDVCCAGCEAIAATIVSAGLHDYYRFRSEPAAFGLVPPDVSASLDELAVYDAPEVLERFAVPDASERRRDDESRGASTPESTSSSTVTLSIEGLRCGACVWLLERRLGVVPGVSSVEVNYATERARVRFDRSALPLSSLLNAAADIGFRARPYEPSERAQRDAIQSRAMRQRLFIAALGAMQVMMYALPGYLDGDIEPRFEQLLRWASLVLTTPVMLYAAQPFFAGAWRDLRARAPGMDVPVALALAVGYAASVIATVRGSGEVWFDSVSMFVFLLLCARSLESGMRQRARRALDVVLTALPATAQRVSSEALGTVERVPAVRLRAGDRIRVASGERVPADGTVEGQPGAVDLSMLTGESMPQRVEPGATVPGGALVAGAPLELLVTRAANDSALSHLTALMERGSAEKPAAERLADRIARRFVAALLVIVAAVFAMWWIIDSSRAPLIAIATLVVSCPCALSLATPAALAAATSRLLGRGVLITRAHALETMAGVTDVVFDKTGTLTVGTPTIVSVRTRDGVTRETALAMAAALDRGTSHPYARALHDASDTARCATPGDPLPDPLSEFGAIEHVPGRGVRAHERGGPAVWRLGSARWSALTPVEQARWRDADDGTGEMFLTRSDADGCQVIARIGLADTLRAGASELVASLQGCGLRVHLLSGDRRFVAERIAAALGIDDVVADATPAGKREHVRALQQAGARVMMVGDGLNDAPVMASADVSLAVGQATDLARTAADAVALSGDITTIGGTLSTARSARRVVRQNLAWALVYNALAIPLTAAGWVPAWAAALGMASSSLLVVLNATRLLDVGRTSTWRMPTRWMRSSC